MDCLCTLVRDFFWNNVEPICVLSSIAILNAPAHILRAEPGQFLYKLRASQPFCSVSSNALNSYLSFSPRNLKEGKWYTVVTSLFNHQGPGHFIGNFIILVSAAPSVIKAVGVTHFLSLYVGGGIIGNLVLLGQYVAQRHLWKGTIPEYKAWWLGSYVDSIKTSSMTTIYNAVNEGRPIIGSSGCVSAVVGYTCVARCVQLWRYFKHKKNAKDNEVVLYRGPRSVFLADAGLLVMRDAIQIGYALTQFKHDADSFVNDFSSSSQSLFSGVFAYSSDGIGHGSHFGGFLFGALYYLFVHGTACQLFRLAGCTI